MDMQVIYDAVKTICVLITFTFIVLSVTAIALAKNETDMMASMGFLVISLFFALETWIIVNTKWKKDSDQVTF